MSSSFVPFQSGSALYAEQLNDAFSHVYSDAAKLWLTSQMYNQGSAIAVPITQQQKNQQVVCFDDLGGVGDGVTDDSPRLSLVCAWAIANNIGTIAFSAKKYYFASPVSIFFDTLGSSIKFAGTSTPSFSGASPAGTVFTGASGISALLLLTKTDLTKQGYYAFSAENINFQGGGNIAAGVKNLVGGGPSRPFVLKGCTLQGFTLGGLVSDLTLAAAAGQVTGICQLHVYDCNITNNGYGIYATGQAAIMNMNCHSNVIEHNTIGGIGGGAFAYQGTIRISDNLLEGQPNPISINLGLGSVEVSRNYFESCTGSLINVSAINSTSKIVIGDQFIYNCANTIVSLQGAVVECKQDFAKYNVVLQLANIYGKSKIDNEGIVSSIYAGGLSLALDVTSVPFKSLPIDPSILNGGYVEVSTSKVDTPAGFIGYKTFAAGTTTKFNSGLSVAAGDMVVMLALCRVNAVNNSYNPSIVAGVWDKTSGNSLGQTSATVGTGYFANGEWAFICRTVSCSAASSNIQVSWLSSGLAADITDTYVYKISQATTTTPIRIFMPPTGLLPNSYYSQTSTSGTTSIVDTGIFGTTPEVGYGTGSVYQLCVTGWTDPAHTSAATTIIGLIVINAAASAQAGWTQITYQNTLSSPASGGLSVSAVFFDGATEYSQLPSTSTGQIRIKVAGYTAGGTLIGWNQKVTLNKIL